MADEFRRISIVDLEEISALRNIITNGAYELEPTEYTPVPDVVVEGVLSQAPDGSLLFQPLVVLGPYDLVDADGNVVGRSDGTLKSATETSDEGMRTLLEAAGIPAHLFPCSRLVVYGDDNVSPTIVDAK